MISKLAKKPWGWEYVSKNGNSYSVGPVTTEFNVIVDDFDDVNKLFDCDALIYSHLVDYVYGDLEEDTDIIKEWIDKRVDRYEKHERTVKFYTNILNRSDADILYECYIGTKEKKMEQATIIQKEEMYKISIEIKGGE